MTCCPSRATKIVLHESTDTGDNSNYSSELKSLDFIVLLLSHYCIPQNIFPKDDYNSQTCYFF